MICQCSISMEAFSKHLSGTVLDRSYPAIPWQGQQLPNNVFSQVRPFNSITLTIVSATLSSSCDLSCILNNIQSLIFQKLQPDSFFPLFRICWFFPSSTRLPLSLFCSSIPCKLCWIIGRQSDHRAVRSKNTKCSFSTFNCNKLFLAKHFSKSHPLQATPALRFFLLVANSMAGQNSVYTWSRDHRFIVLFFYSF